MIAALVLCLVSTTYGFQTSNTISLSGSITYWPQVYVNVKTSNIIDSNPLSLGFQLSWNTELTQFPISSEYKQLASNAEFKMIRFFSHILDPCSYWNESTKTGTFEWTNVDNVVRSAFEIGAEPFITLGFCDHNGIIIPKGMATDPATLLPNPDDFSAYCREWVRHFKELALPVKYYEVINEPYFYYYSNWNFNGTKLGYYLTLFNTCYVIMHNENPGILIGCDSSLYRKFLDYWIAHGGPLDFLSFHKYDSYGPSENDSDGIQRAETQYIVTSSLIYGVKDAQQKWFNATGATLPAINSESNWSAYAANGTDPRLQQVLGAVWTALTIRNCILNGVQYSVYYAFASSKSWELSKGTGYGFGMINSDDKKPWYPYFVQEMIGQNLMVGDSIVESSSSSNDLRSIAWVHNNTLDILLVCKTDQPRTVSLQGVSGQLNVSRINNAIPYTSPSVQTGSIGSTQSLITDGYEVILLQGLM